MTWKLTRFFNTSVGSGAIRGCRHFKNARIVYQLLHKGISVPKAVNMVVFELVEVGVRSLSHQDREDLGCLKLGRRIEM